MTQTEEKVEVVTETVQVEGDSEETVDQKLVKQVEVISRVFTFAFIYPLSGVMKSEIIYLCNLTFNLICAMASFEINSTTSEMPIYLMIDSLNLNPHEMMDGFKFPCY